MRPCLIAGALLLSPQAFAQASIPRNSVPTDTGEVRGKIDRFTLSAEGEPDGFLLDDGTEVHVHVYLAHKLTSTVRRGDAVTVKGLRASGLPLISATNVTADLSQQSVVDTGSPAGWKRTPPSGAAAETSVEGTIERAIHGSTGSVVGAFLGSGVEVRMPDGIAADWPTLLKAGQTVAVTGQDIPTQYGRVVRIEMLGPSADQLSPVTPGLQPPPTPRPVQ